MNKKKLPDLRENFDHRSFKPFGTYTAKKIVSLHFPNALVTIKNKKFSYTRQHDTDSNTLYVCIARNFFTTEDDAQAMLDYVYNGNTLFISSSNLDTILLSRVLAAQLKISDRVTRGYYAQTKITLQPELQKPYQYFYRPFQNYFKEIRAENSFPIGFNEDQKPNSFILFWGKGRLILHCDPRAFSNYFLLTNDNYKYLDQFLTFIEPTATTIYWDDYFRNHNVRSTGEKRFSAFDELLKHPPLTVALCIFLLLLALYILFNSKRRQRIIPEMKRVSNSSVGFTETIARLYLQQKDNKNIAEKMITYFHEHIRKHYFMNSGLSDEDFISTLSRKSGVELEKTSELFYAIKEVGNSFEVNDVQLVKLNNHFQQFYKNKN